MTPVAIDQLGKVEIGWQAGHAAVVTCEHDQAADAGLSLDRQWRDVRRV